MFVTFREHLQGCAAMPRSRETLIGAMTAKQGAEDRLTEVFATVLDTHDGLAAALFNELGLPVGQRFQVFTQVRVSPGSRPDMVLHSLDRAGAVVSRVWSEHKIDAGFGDLQLERYLEALRTLPGKGELIFVAREAPTARVGAEWRGFTWQEIGELVDRVGRAWAGAEWLRRAVEP